MHTRIWFFCWLTILAQPASAGVEVEPRLQIQGVSHSPEQPRSGQVVKIVAQVANQPGKVSLHVEYQVVDPGKYIDLTDSAYKTNWLYLAMNDSGKNGDEKAGDGIYTVELPAELQIHRRLVRYRITATDSSGQTNTAPALSDSEPNFAYFVYDGIPGWSGAIDPNSNDPRKKQIVRYDPAVMASVQAYHFISKGRSVANATWREQSGGKEYKYTGTLVSDGKVYDHVRFRARGGVWRYAMGKNMWKFDFNKGHPFQARDDYGQPYRVKWGKLNLRACIQQGDYGQRGEQGMFESVGFRLFSLAGVAAPRTHWLQLRIIDLAEENPTNQYRGDFWGLYLALENEDGHFLDEHGLPDGNLYKMENGSGTLSHHGTGAVTNSSDLHQFMSAYNTGNRAEPWWRAHLDLASYYSYRSIIECIHHYDVADGKNYDYYLNPKTGRWNVIPWDIDLTWADNMYGNGEEPFRSRVLTHPAFHVEYQNRLREIRDLLFNPEQTGQLIDECAAIIADPAGGPSLVDADRAKWDYHPVMARIGGKAGQGRFYEAAASKDFRGMLKSMKDYVKNRAAWIDANLLNDPRIPATPSLLGAGSTNLTRNHLSFRCSQYSGSGVFAAMKWRVAEAGKQPAEFGQAKARMPCEITAVWESAEGAAFNPSITIPPEVVRAGRTYRVRVQMKDQTGRWSYWSAPIQFTVAPPAG